MVIEKIVDFVYEVIIESLWLRLVARCLGIRGGKIFFAMTFFCSEISVVYRVYHMQSNVEDMSSCLELHLALAIEIVAVKVGILTSRQWTYSLNLMLVIFEVDEQVVAHSIKSKKNTFMNLE